MGIFGLKHYMRNDCANGFELVELEEIARQYKQEMSEDPVMLVDISASAHFFDMHRDVPVDIRAMQGKLELFIKKCDDFGIKLKFIGDGMKPSHAYKGWKEKKLHTYKKKQKTKTVHRHINFHVGLILSICPVLCQSYNNSEYLRAVYDADTYILRYAKTKGCFAILTNDTDILLGAGARYCLCVEKFDFNAMRGYNINRNSLAASLNMSPSLLPVFGALAESQLFGAKYNLKVICAQKDPESVRKYFYQLAEKIERCPVKDDAEKMVAQFAAEKSTTDRVEFIRKYKLYAASEPEKGVLLLGDAHWDEILRAAEKRHVTGIAEKRLLEIIDRRVCFLPPKSDLIPAVTAVQMLAPLREKMYGIIFSEHPDREVGVMEYTFRRDKRTVYSYEKEVQSDRLSHPGLLELWSENRSKEMMHKRRQLFCKALDDKLTVDILDAADLPEELIFPVLAMFYLQRHTESPNAEFRLKLFLMGTILAYKLSGVDIKPFPVQLDFRVHAMSDPFLTAVEHLQLLNSVCGEPFSLRKTNLNNYYDGNIYHYVFRLVSREYLPGDNFCDIDLLDECNELKNKLDKIIASCGHNGNGVTITEGR